MNSYEECLRASVEKNAATTGLPVSVRDELWARATSLASERSADVRETYYEVARTVNPADHRQESARELLARASKINLGGQEVVSLLGYGNKKVIRENGLLQEILKVTSVPFVVETPAQGATAAHVILMNASAQAMGEFVRLGRQSFARTLAHETSYFHRVDPRCVPTSDVATLKARLDEMTSHAGVQGAEIVSPTKAAVYLEAANLFLD